MLNKDLEQNLGILSCNKEVLHWDYKNNLGVIVPKSGLLEAFLTQGRENEEKLQC